MSSYPPPPPPPGPGYAGYDRAAWKAQRRMAKEQFRAQRMQWRMQQRYMRRGSLVGPLVLLAVGIVLLLDQTGRLSWARTMEWYGRWWPIVLIVAGVILLVEWLLDTQRQDESGAPAGRRVLGGGVVFLLIVLAMVGWSTRWADSAPMWRHHHYMGHELGGWSRVFGEAHESDAAMTEAIPAGAELVVHNPYGGVTVSGSSDDGQVHLSMHKQVYAWHDNEADAKAERMRPVFTTEGNQLRLELSGMDQGQADLTIEVPRGSAITVSADHGDVRVSEVHAAVTIAARTGDLDLSGINGPVTVRVNNDDASVAARSVTGSFTLQGRAGDISLSNIDGSVMLQGDFFGTTHAEHVNGPLRFETSRTRFSTARVDGEVQIERGDLQGNQLLGPVTLTTHDRTVELDDVAGPVQVGNRNGSVSVTSAAPLGPVEITNQHGSVDLGLPASSGFLLEAQTRNGELENDFGLRAADDGNQHRLTGSIGPGGPSVRVITSDGDVTVRKSVVPPVPPKPPEPQKISDLPGAPASTPNAGKAGHAKEKTVQPAKPAAPAVPEMPTPPGASEPTAREHPPALL